MMSGGDLGRGVRGGVRGGVRRVERAAVGACGACARECGVGEGDCGCVRDFGVRAWVKKFFKSAFLFDLFLGINQIL